MQQKFGPHRYGQKLRQAAIAAHRCRIGAQQPFLWMFSVVGAIGFEPTTYGTQNRRATRLRYAPTAVFLQRNAAKGKPPKISYRAKRQPTRQLLDSATGYLLKCPAFRPDHH